jgi:hypothetical protein
MHRQDKKGQPLSGFPAYPRELCELRNEIFYDPLFHKNIFSIENADKPDK